MFVYFAWVAVCLTVVNADCGHCPTENISSKEELLQAQAYNAMPKHWRSFSRNSKNALGLVKVRHGYGPWRCTTPCATETGSGGYTMCSYTAKTKTETRRGHDYCAKPYHDNGNRKCIEAPEWDESYGMMWCRTYYEGSIWNWGHTHFPICAATNKICAYANK